MNATVSAIRTRAETELGEQFGFLRDGLPGGPAVAALRARAFDSFLRSGLPNRRVEAWKFTDLRAALRTAAPPLLAAAAGRTAPPPASFAKDAWRLALVDGHYRPDLSGFAGAPAGLRVRSLADALADASDVFLTALAPQELAGDPMAALNAAMMTGGLVVEVEPGLRLDRPVEILRCGGSAESGAIFARSLVRLGKGAGLTLIESAEAGGAPRQANVALVLALEEAARLDHVWLAGTAAAGSLAVETVIARLGPSAQLFSTAFVADAPFLRRQTFLRFEGPGAEAGLSGLSLLRGEEHADNTLVVEHVAPRCRSRELFKHIVDGAAEGAFQGKIVVAPGAQKTDGVMASRAILLSDAAGMDNKPELEIFADDVVCGHGATCGELDHNQLFYAMSRGLPRPQAEALLLEAFAGEALDQIADATLRESAHDSMRAWLARRSR